MYIGEFNRKPCTISILSPNEHILSTGGSGVGKTCRDNVIALDCARNKKTVIVLDVHQTHVKERIFYPLSEEYEQYTNRISILNDGLDLSLLNPIKNSLGVEEPFIHHVNSVLNALSSNQNMGSKQIAALRTAIIHAIQTRYSFSCESAALATALLREEDANSYTVYQRLWTLLNSNILRPSQSKIKKGAINILDFTGIDDLTQATLSEVILSTLWRNVQFGGLQNTFGEIVIILDEFQNLSLKQGSTLRLMLHEGRKFGIKLVLSTQTLEVFPRDVLALLNQPATRLYFKPSPFDLYKTAKEILMYTGYDLSKELASLQIGECYGVGNFYCDGAEINRPILLK